MQRENDLEVIDPDDIHYNIPSMRHHSMSISKPITISRPKETPRNKDVYEYNDEALHH